MSLSTLAEPVSQCTIVCLALRHWDLRDPNWRGMEALMPGKQGLVLLQIMLAVVLLLVLISIPGVGREFPAPQDDDVAARLAFAAKWLLVPALCLLAGIGALGSLRFFSDDAIDGTRTPASRTLEINIRYNLNTLEQTVLAAANVDLKCAARRRSRTVDRVVREKPQTAQCTDSGKEKQIGRAAWR